MQETHQLIEDYNRKISTLKNDIDKGGDGYTMSRLSTKESCYRTFIVELERLKSITEIDQLIEDYNRKISTLKNEINKGGDDYTMSRLSTKASCFRTFIVELERLKSSTKA